MPILTIPAPRAIVCAYSAVGRDALAGLLEAGIQVTSLYTYPQPAEDMWFESPASLAKRHGIPVRMVPDFNTDEVFQALEAEAPDLIFSFYFREMIRARVLELPRLGAYNLHGSLLPAYRGRAPINWALVRGERETGITLHAMTPKPDDGDILGQERLPIAWDETALSLTLRMAEAGRELVRRLAPEIIQGVAPSLAQSTLGSASYFGGRSPKDSRLDFSMSVTEAFNQIRAVADPWPNAFLETAAGRIKVPWGLPSDAPCEPGTFRPTADGVLLGFRDGSLCIHALRRDGLRSERPTEHALWLQALDIPRSMP